MISAFGQKNAYLTEDFFSRGQIMKLSIQLMVNKILTLKKEHDVIPFILIDDANILDEKLLSYINKIVEKYDIQVAYLWVGDKPKEGKFSILIEERQIKEYVKPK